MNTIQDQLESLYGKAKQYTENSIELYKLQAIGKTADIVSALVSRLALFTIISLFTLFVNIAISLFIGKQMGAYYLGFLIVSCFYLILAILVYFFNNKLIKTPITNLVIEKLLKPRELVFTEPKTEENE